MNLDFQQVLTQAVGFLILLGLLKLFFWKPVISLLDQRKEKIAAEFKHIEDAKAELATLKAEYETRLASIEEIARQKIKEAVEEGKRITDELKSKAEEQARQIIESGRENIRQELLKTKQELKSHIVDLALRATESIILEKLTADHDKKLVEDFLDKIDRA
ncbi:MAG: ATP synthase F0 subunit B [Omnitrophica WOR_2 bacterium GWF2_43_52]|nr:MAG: ATP synthase F0 subunit B [Omnitrophica WOR_2 bacterium GWA2_44_7]OGX20764.1 MAG: ATP synthase F0 subunit B [Omnitrophica WOR_2 bacterium GWF2_43_52]OGX58632.1 MAG: ATP synthase F0 subunit B [Omnitrophica WOR_2 bacterium RIFOXYC2_FULL_43_9]